MEILWELRHGSALILRVHGKRLDGRGSFSQQLPPAGSTQFQFPSIIVVPTPGCSRLTLQVGKTTGRVTIARCVRQAELEKDGSRATVHPSGHENVVLRLLVWLVRV